MTDNKKKRFVTPHVKVLSQGGINILSGSGNTGPTTKFTLKATTYDFASTDSNSNNFGYGDF